MTVLSLRPGHHLAVPYSFTPQTVHYQVESEFPTTVHVMSAEGLAQFRSGQQFQSFRTSGPLNIHQGDLQIAGPATWYLVIVNALAQPTAVYYHVWSR